MAQVNLKGTMTFSDEQAMLLDTATDYFRDKFPMAYVRDQMLSSSGYEQTRWDEMVALGWSGLAIPEEFGGSGLGLAAAVTIAEPMGRALAATPFLSTQLFVQGMLHGGSVDQKNAYLSQIAEGKIGTVALFEDSGGWDLTDVGVELIDGRLKGAKTFVVDAGVADWVLVSARRDGELVVVVVNKADLTGSTLEREVVIDETRRSYRLSFNGTPAAEVLGDASTALNAIRNAALLLIAAESGGGIAGVLNVVVEYLTTRTAFGKKIGGFQGLKHPTVDILIGLERTRSHVYHAASLLDAGEDAQAAIHMAKAEASDSFAFAGDRAIQFHGGFGFTWDCDAQMYLRRALWSQYSFGDAAYHRKQLAALLL
ncbi:MAG: acyl-CoA/acyl-ACP dehydrogenase [Proteobacteria bacterium]|nr:acyl-CoA/acyl-ACP dehydrogenase [Pseudomonadota bacterium]